MNGIRSRKNRVPALLPRAAGAALTEALALSPVTVVIGARQTGKSTLVQTLPILADRSYLTLDDFNLRDARHLLTFRAEYGKAVCGCLLVHGGNETFWLADGILAAPWWRIL